MNSEDRIQLLEACHAYLQTRTEILEKAMKALKEDLENESKSSAGDKYETGREMINIEWNKLSVQLNEYDRLAHILRRIEKHKPSEKAVLGSIVKTEAANYFISIPAGEIVADNQKFYAVGIQAPIAQKMLGKQKGDKFELNGREFRIMELI